MVKITAANKLPLPYLGYVELDIQVMGLTIPECGFLIVRDGGVSEPDSTPSAIIGMNIAQRCRQLVISEFDNTLGGNLDSVWREAFHRVQQVELIEKTSIVRLSGKHKAYVPASSVATVHVKVHKRPAGSDVWALFEPGNGPLPGGLVPVPTLVPPHSKVFPVQVVNFSSEDVWLPSKTRVGVLAHCQRMESNPCELRFHCMSARQEGMNADEEVRQETKSDMGHLLDGLQIGGTPEQQTELRVLLKKYADVFAASEDDLGYTDKVKHEIPLVDNTAVSQPYQRIPPNQFKELGSTFPSC